MAAGIPPRRRRQRQAAVLRLGRPAPGRGRGVLRRRRHARLPGAAQARRVRVRPRPADAGAAEHRRRLVHARHRRVAGRARLDEQHVPHQRRRAVRRTRTAAFAHDASVLQAETLAQSAERGGKKVAQIEWAGGRSGVDQRPDRRLPQLPSPAAAWPRTTSRRPTARRSRSPSGCSSTTRPGSPATRRSRRPRRRTRPAGPTCRAPTRPRRRCACACWTAATDKYGLNAYLYDSRNDRKTNYDRVLFSRTKSGADKVADLAEGEFADVKVKIVGGASEGKTASFLVKVERLARDLKQVRLFHTSVTRAFASWPGWSRERGFTGTFEDYVAERFPSSQAGDFAVLEAGIVSEDTYIEQGDYWAKLYHPLIKYVLDKYKPDLAMVGDPRTDEVQHQFLGLVTKKLPNGAEQPGVRRRQRRRPQGRPRRRSARRYIRDAYAGSDKTMRLAQDYMRDRDLTTFVALRPRLRAAVPGHRRQQGAGRPRPALDAADGQLPPGDGRDDRQGQGLLRRRRRCRSTSTSRAATRRRRGLQQVAAADEAATGRADPRRVPRPEGHQRLDRRRPARELEGHRPHLHQGRGPLHPERRELDGRHGAPDAHGRPRRRSPYPPYQFDAATPGTLIARSAFFGQHGYVPDVQDLKSNTNMRATFLAGGDAIERGEVDDVRSRSTSRRRRRSCSTSRRRSTARASSGATCSTTAATTRRSTSSA